jgi:hypothetical protein
VLSQFRSEARAMYANLTWKDLVEKGFVIAGSPDTVAERMEDMIEQLHIGHVFGLFHMGDMPDWKVRRSTQLFADKVMPRLRTLWPQWRDDDRWWCKPLPQRVQMDESWERRLDAWESRRPDDSDSSGEP